MTKINLDRSEGAAVNNMKSCFKICSILAVVATVWRSVAFITSFDSDVGYFNGSFLPTVANWLLVLSVAIALSGFYFINKNAVLPKTLDASPNSVYFASIFAGFVLAADFIYKIYVMIGDERFEYYAYIFKKGFRSDNSYLLRATAIIEIVGALSALLAAVWFFLRSSKKTKNGVVAALGFFPVLRALSGIAVVYFDMTVQMNHPSKLLLQIALIAIMFYFLCEIRFFVSEKHPRPRRYFVSGCVTILLGIVCGVSEMVGFFVGRTSKGAFCVEAFFCLTVGIYTVARVASFVKSAESVDEPIAEQATDEVAELTEISE